MREKDILLAGAWDRLFRMRTCPPLDVLQKGGALAKQHLAGCPWCRETLANAAQLERLGNALMNIPVSPVPSTGVKMGDIRQVKPLGSAEAWFDAEGTYHNPPYVLVLDAPDMDCFVTVAQIFNFPDLAGELDIPLNGGRHGYAESWNTYNLPITGLSVHSWLQASAAEVRNVREAARLPQPERPELDLLRQFRRCEFNTGAFFSVPLNSRALHVLEKRGERDSSLPLYKNGRLLGSTDWLSIPAAYTSARMDYALAAASAYKVVNLGDGRQCHVEFVDGTLIYEVNSVPDGIVYAVVIRLHGQVVEVETHGGQVFSEVILTSDSQKRRKCALTEDEFDNCVVDVYPIAAPDC